MTRDLSLRATLQSSPSTVSCCPCTYAAKARRVSRSTWRERPSLEATGGGAAPATLCELNQGKKQAIT